MNKVKMRSVLPLAVALLLAAFIVLVSAPRTAAEKVIISVTDKATLFMMFPFRFDRLDINVIRKCRG